MDKTTVCKNCGRNKEKEFLECYRCGKGIHPRCANDRKEHGTILGDVFFTFLCRDCNGDGSDKLERDRMAWLDVVLLALYNLSKTNLNQSFNGYFNCNRHIIKFVDNHWKSLFPYVKTKRKSYKQMITSTLKSYTPEYFVVGDETLHFPSCPSTWYKLSRPDILPVDLLIQRKDKKKKRRQETDKFSYYSEESMWCDGSSYDADYHFSNPGVSSFHMFCSDTSASEENMYSRSYVKPTASLSEYLFAEDDASDEVDIDVTDSESVVDIRCKGESPSVNIGLSLARIKPSSLEIKTERSKGAQIKEEVVEKGEAFVVIDPEDVGESKKIKTGQSLLARNKNWDYKPWIKNGSNVVGCSPVNENEENYLLSSLRKRILESDEVSVADIRLHRKLIIRKLRRERKRAVFNLDEVRSKPEGIESGNQRRILDRYRHQTVYGTIEEEAALSFRTRLMGHTERFDSFISPFTGRRLKPFIRRDFESLPLWPKLLQELETKFDGGARLRKTRFSIDYTYVRPQHIPAVNSLASQYFWPGINLSECLQYPDFSCVVLYKKLLVAFAFMVPDVGYNEAYISFIFTRPEWRRAGIGTFMLYHLIQTCMGRDITLHVSATNSALFLYQRFGFKVEEFVQGFYEKYLPADSNECKHALFLRLSR